MKLVFQIAAGVFLALAAMNLIEYSIAAYQVQLVIDGFQKSVTSKTTATVPSPRKPPRQETRSLPPRSKSECLAESGNSYNETYLICRQGRELTVLVDPNTGTERVLRARPIVKDVNVL